MAEKMQWNVTPAPTAESDQVDAVASGMPAGVTDASSGMPPGVTPAYLNVARKTWSKRDLTISIILFVVLAPLLLVSLGALAANVMALAAMSNPVAGQGPSAFETMRMWGLIAVTTAYPFVYALSLVVTVVQKKITWVTYLVVIAALPMCGIVAWLMDYSASTFSAL